MTVVAAIAVATYRFAALVRQVLDALTVAFTILPAPEVTLENGRFVQQIADAAAATEVVALNCPATVTCRPILVYLPEELNVPTTVRPPPWLGVQVPSSYQLSNWLVIPASGVLAVKLTPLAAVP